MPWGIGHGNKIGRQLFASILRREADGCYYLVTPHEKFRIDVADAPFVIIDAELTTVDNQQQVYFRTNVDDYVKLDCQHPLAMRGYRPYVQIREQLWGLIGRSVFYRLVASAAQRTIDGETHMVLRSAQTDFSLAKI